MNANFRSWKLVIVVMTCGMALAAGVLQITHRPSIAIQPNESSSTLPAADGQLPVLWTAPAFSFPDQDGQIVTNRGLLGHPWICDFIYTRCTTVCPVLTARMILLQRSLQNPGIRFVSFTVDPTYDTPAVLKAYAQQWHGNESRWRLLATESDEAVHATVHAMHLAVQHVDDPINPIVHTNRFVLFDSAGRARGLYDSTDENAITKLIRDTNSLIEAGPPELLQASSSAESPSTQPGGINGGKQLFMVMGCAACHAQARIAPLLDGLAGTEVKLEGGKTVIADDAYLRESIFDPAAKVVAGYPPTMPSYRTHLSEAQADSIIAYIKSTVATKSLTAPTTRMVVIDPVCGMQVSAGDDTPRVVYEGKTYYFCSDDCKQKFQKEPAKYAKPVPAK